MTTAAANQPLAKADVDIAALPYMKSSLCFSAERESGPSCARPLMFDFAFHEAALATDCAPPGSPPQQRAKASAPRFVTSRHCVNLFSLRQRLRNFAGAFDEELGYRAEGAAF